MVGHEGEDTASTAKCIALTADRVQARLIEVAIIDCHKRIQNTAAVHLMKHNEGWLITMW